MDRMLKKELAEAGLRVQEGNAYYHEVTPDLLHKFQVVVMLYPPGEGATKEREIYRSKFHALLNYMQAGGGLIIFADEQYGAQKSLNEFLSRLDAEILPESIVDEATQFRQKGFFREYFFTTTKLASHPVTRNVKQVCFPSAWHPQMAGATEAIRAGEEWQVLIRGNDTACSLGWRADIRDRRSYSKAPPIVAVRDYGRGRVALLPTRSVTTLQSGYHFIFEGICFKRGDFRQLLANLLDWLSEPARQAGQPGGYVAPCEWPAEISTPKAPESLDMYTRLAISGFREPVSEIRHKTRPMRDYVGIIGIYSDFSRRLETPYIAGGWGSISRYCQKARQLGLSFLAFTERFEVMNEEKWNRLVKECCQNSDERLIAIPGIEIEDVYGDRWACLDLPRWVQKEWLDPSGRYLVDHPGFYFGLSHQSNVFLARFLLTPKQSFYPPWLAKFYAGMEVAGYQHGNQLIEDAFDWYLQCQANDYNLIPIAIHRISSPEELSQANGCRVHVQAEKLSDVPAAFRYGWYTPRSVYLSSGPLLKEFAIENGRAAFRDEEWHLFIHIEGRMPLREVVLYDRKQIFRRWRPKSRIFRIQVSGYHERQHFFTLTAADASGGRLISPALYTSDVRHSTYMCTDLQNTINTMVDVTRAGKADYFRVQGLYVTGWDSLDVPSLVAASDVLPESGIEYGFAPAAGGVGPVIYGKDKTEHSIAQRDMVFDCGDVNMLDNLYRYTLLPGSYAAPTEYAHSTVRFISFTPRAYHQNVMLIEQRITFKRDVLLSRREGPEIIALRLNVKTEEGQAREFARAASEGFPQMCIRRSDGRKQFVPRGNKPFIAPLPEGSYAAFYPNFWGSLAVFPLSDGLSLHVADEAELGWEMPGRAIRKGTMLKARYLVVRGQFDRTDETEFDALCKQLGLDGPPAYQVSLNRGQILDTTYLLRLKADGNIAAFAIGGFRLDNPLPVVIEGLQSNWDAVMLDSNTGQLHRVGVFEGKGWLTVEVRKEKRHIWVGNAIICNRPEMKLSLFQRGRNWLIEVHNPTDRSLSVKLQVASWLKGIVPAFETTMRLESGQIWTKEIPASIQ